MTNQLHMRQITTLEDAQRMRLIRNQCRTFMTRDQREITEEDQAAWWCRLAALDFPGLEAYLFFEEPTGDVEPVGYGIIQWPPGQPPWLTGGLIPEARGLGYGRELFRWLMARVDGPCRLEVLLSNTTARVLYAKLGFAEVGAPEQRISTTGEQHTVLTLEYR